jgi:hypothetical protein
VIDEVPAPDSTVRAGTSIRRAAGQV